MKTSAATPPNGVFPGISCSAVKPRTRQPNGEIEMPVPNQITIDGGDLPDRFVSRDVAAKYLSLSTRTLATWASAGIGPVFTKLSAGRSGAVRYSLEELRKFAADPAAYRPRPVAAFHPATAKRRHPVKVSGPNVARSRRRRNGKARAS
jgi:hypothetical protein